MPVQRSQDITVVFSFQTEEFWTFNTLEFHFFFILKLQKRVIWDEGTQWNRAKSTVNFSAFVEEHSHFKSLWMCFYFQWNFTFDRFEVEPGQTYQVTVYHLPKLGVVGDYNFKSMSHTMPGKRCSSSFRSWAWDWDDLWTIWILELQARVAVVTKTCCSF